MYERLISSIKKDGFRYSIHNYSNYNGIHDEKFHRLRMLAIASMSNNINRKQYYHNWYKLKHYIVRKLPELDGYCEVEPYKYDIDKRPFRSNCLIMEETITELVADKYKDDIIKNTWSRHELYEWYMDNANKHK